LTITLGMKEKALSLAEVFHPVVPAVHPAVPAVQVATPADKGAISL
jgi:hypothetical protein